MRRGLRPLALAATAVATTALAGPASAATPTDTQALQDYVKVGGDRSGIMAHLKELQRIADRNGGNRATATPGHEASVKYVVDKLNATGYFTVSTQPFIAAIWEELADPTLASTPAPAGGWTLNTNFASMSGSGSGAATGQAAVVDYTPPTNQASASSAGCDAADFTTTPVAGRIAVIQRGTCDFGLKAKNAQDRGALGVIIFNEGTLGDPDRNGMINGTVEDYGVTIPTLETTYAGGKHFVDNPTASISITTNTITRRLETRNVIAATKTGRTDRQVVVGAHLDSVPEGPGINDDGSGVGSQLETAIGMSKLNIKPVNQVKFLFFSGEEQGLYGSDFYATSLSKAERSGTMAMLDFDMLASPNFSQEIYDGDGSDFGVAGPNGSGTVEAVFQDFFDARGEYTETMPFDGRSDYDGFTAVGIPAGGIATGAEVHKTPEQQAYWGGTVSEGLDGQYDPCYHLACDSYPDNISTEALDLMSDAVAHSTLTFAQTQSSVKGTDKASTGATKPYDWKGNHLRK